MIMKIIKFRVWDKKKKKIIYLDQFFINENLVPNLVNYDLSSWKNCIPMQFTGLKDKNGKEIYEEDIVKNESGRIMKIGFLASTAYCGFDLIALNSIGKPPKDHAIWIDLEVIGNIYEKNTYEYP